MVSRIGRYTPDASGQYPHPDLNGHINLPKNPAVIDRIMQYLAAVQQ